MPFQPGHCDGESTGREALVGLGMDLGQSRQQRVGEDPVGIEPTALPIVEPPVDLFGLPDRALSADAAFRVATLERIHDLIHDTRVVGLILQQPSSGYHSFDGCGQTVIGGFRFKERIKRDSPLSHQLKAGLAEQMLAAKGLHEAVLLLETFEAPLERGQLCVGPGVLRSAIPEGAEGAALDGHSDQVAVQSGILTSEFREPKDRVDVFRRARRVAGGHPRRRSRAQLHSHGLVNGQVRQQRIVTVGIAEVELRPRASGRLGNLVEHRASAFEGIQDSLRSGHPGRWDGQVDEVVGLSRFGAARIVHCPPLSVGAGF